MSSFWLPLRTATRIEFRERPDGESHYIVHFREAITDLKDFKDKMSLQFMVTGRHGAPTRWGSKERATALAFTAYTAHLYDEELPRLRFGCGALKLNGFHGGFV